MHRFSFSALAERFMPPDPGDDDSVRRSQFLVRAWLGAMILSIVSTVAYAVAEVWPQVVTSAVLVVAAAVVLPLHRRGVSRVVLSHASLTVASLVFGLGSIAQRPADHTTFAMLIISPLLAGLLIGPRAMLAWTTITAAWGTAISVAIDREWLFDFVDPQPTVAHAINFIGGLFVIFGFVSTFDELSRRALLRLRSVDAARRAFLANVSHEIRTPMNGMLGITELLLLESQTPEHQEQLKTIQRSGRVLVALINDLLDLSKMEAGKLTVERTNFNLARLLHDVEALAAPRAAATGLRLEVRRSPGVPERLFGDGLRLGQVLNNLMGNALKFTERGSVTLTVEASGEQRYRFSVEDTGVGIDATALSQLFSPFQQGDSSTTRRFGGTGLGLALSQQLVSLMGGRIEVSSTPGSGSRFWFDLELRDADELSGEHRIVPNPLRQSKRSVLVVDDNPVNLKVAMALVQKVGCEVEGAVNGAAALAALRRRAFDLVLMDCHMPEMDGFEATERIRALGGQRGRTPIIALTASAMPEDIAACQRVGMNLVLAKPVTLAALQDAISSTTGVANAGA